MEEKRKSLKDLTLLDRFLFAEAMEDPFIMQSVLEIILGKEIVLKGLPQVEKEGRTAPSFRSIRLDVWAWDEEDTVYDTEVQQKDTQNLPKRSRFYQAVMDSKLLEPGNIDFNELNKAYIIIITPFDLFGKGLYQYSFEMQCKEVPGLSLKDDMTRIFLNTRGTNSEDVRPELVELLHYMEYTKPETEQSCANGKLRDVQKRIDAIKSNREVGVKYMQAWEEKVLWQQEAREESRQMGIATILELLEEKGAISAETKERVTSQKDIKVLHDWIKKAARVRTIEEFEHEVKK